MHTNGPWRIGVSGVTIYGPPNSNPVPEEIATVNTEANARLIAAAPALLEALQSIMSMTSEKSAWGPEAIIDDIRSEAKAALAQATKG